MAFGASMNRVNDHGRWITIPYDGKPTMQLFIPQTREGNSQVILFWRGYLVPHVLAEWLKLTAALFENSIHCIADIWSDVPMQTKIYDASNIAGIESDLSPISGEVMVALDIHETIPPKSRFYVWADLRPTQAVAHSNVGNDGDACEVGIKLAPDDLFDSSAGKAIVSRLIRKSSPIEFNEWEIEDLFSQLHSKLLHTYMLTG
jgi:hypothetical protein